MGKAARSSRHGRASPVILGLSHLAAVMPHSSAGGSRMPCDCRAERYNMLSAEAARQAQIKQVEDANKTAQRLATTYRSAGIIARDMTAITLAEIQGGNLVGGLTKGFLVGAMGAFRAEQEARDRMRPRFYYGTNTDSELDSRVPGTYSTLIVGAILVAALSTVLYASYGVMRPEDEAPRRGTAYADCCEDLEEGIEYERYKNLSRR